MIVGSGSKKQDLLYIMNPKCGWCTKANPVVDELRKDGYDITTLDVTNQGDAERANEVKSRHSAQCGTPLFLDAVSGNSLCGFREKPDLEKWAKGEVAEVKPTAPTAPTPEQKPTPKKYKLEYIWTDGNGNMRSKVRYSTIIQSPNEVITIDKIPDWSFDGSSTNQSETSDSDLTISPVRLFPNPMESRQMPTWYVLCEVLNQDGTPHESNYRKKLWETLEKNKSHNIWIAIEQEYVVVDSNTGKPFGWKDYDESTPPPQGDYYCGVGSDKQKGRMVAEHHANLCIQSGLAFEGFHPEVMLSQWEYQIGIGTPLDMADQLLFSRFLLQRVTERTPFLSVSFDSKVEEGDWNGSGAHINFSTKYMREESTIEYLNIICSSLAEFHSEAIESYGNDNHKRLTGKHETSSIDKFTWGENDRSASIRIPHSSSDGNSYLEDRRPSSSMNPYEALSYLVSTVSKVSEELLVTT
jgi:glutamine synthetase